MLETFLILLSGGVMLAVVISNPREVTLNWLRLAGILAMVFLGMGVAAFFFRRETMGRDLLIASLIAVAGILLQLAFAQTAKRGAQRLSGGVAMMATIALAGLCCIVCPGRTRAPCGSN
jgi:peptidoglycan/LPS O-acetylase OafA/YrhL